MIIQGSQLITCKLNLPTIDEGAIAVRKGRIASVGKLEEIKKLFPRDSIVLNPNAVLLPGLVNLHTHLELPPLLHIIRARTFSKWVLNLIREKRILSPVDYQAAATQNIGTLIETGTTMVGEICTHGVSTTLLGCSGLRAVIFRELIHMGPERSRFSLQSSNLPRSGLVSGGLSPHTPYTVSETALREINRLSNDKNIRLAMHIAESKEELRLLQQKKSGLEKLYEFANWNLTWAPTGKSSFEYLDRIGFLSPHLMAVHAVHVTDKDITLIRKSNVSVAHCPRSNKELGVGRMPLEKLLEAGITVGLGTDSLASVPTLSMWDEMRYAYGIHKRDGISAEDIFGLATIGGARALGLDKEIGTLETGKKADIIAVPLPKKNTGDLYSDLLRETKSCIMSVVNGKILFKEG